MNHSEWFDKVTDRRGSYSLKWDVAEKELPMWVADMDFQTAPEILAAIQKRAEHGIFGYSIVPDSWREAVCGWWKRRHHFEMEQDWLIYATGVVPILSSVVRKLTTPAENVLLLTPVYNIFFNSIVNNGRNALECPLLFDGTGYAVDFDALEKMLAMSQTTMLFFCNPHNPVGKIWEKDTLERIGELCALYHVVVVSDEIHCDITDPEKEYIPFASVSEACRNNSITCIAPTKTFNLAGLQTAAAVIPNEWLRRKVDRGLNTDEVAEPNAFAIVAAEAAFQQGEVWLDALREYLYTNKRLVGDFLQERIPQLELIPSEATYLLWLNARKISPDSEELADWIRKETGLYLSNGKQFGKTGEAFLRMNIACPKAVLEEGLRRLEEAVSGYVRNL